MISADLIRQTGYGDLLNFSNIVTDVVIDSRKVSEGSLFIALPGENTDGHQFVHKALQSGAELCIVSKTWAEQNDISSLPLWIVDSPEKALQKLAKTWRLQFDIPVLAITGTNGKTTTRSMCNAVLATQYNVHTTSGNLNNQLGLPLTLLKMNDSHTFSVLELGTNHFGEIALLCELCQPTAGLITNIGHGHTEFFGSRDGVARAKQELFDALDENAISFINLNDKYIRSMNPKTRIVTFGMNSDQADFNGIITDNDKNGCATLEINSNIQIHLKVPGSVMAQNALAAVAIAKTFNITDQNIITALESFDSVNQRFMVRQTKICCIINDAYNANPDSTKAAIQTFSMMTVPGRRVFVFGDMFELGKLSQSCHEEIGNEIIKAPIDILFTYGPLSQTTHSTVQKNSTKTAWHFEDKTALIKALKNEIQPEDTVLFKSSRGNKLEEVIEGILQ